MLRYVTRALAACASIAAITLLAPTASADLPIHPRLQVINPTSDDIGPDGTEQPEFGDVVVIRDQLAFIAMPGRSPDGGVGVYAATATALVRTGTITPSDVPLFGRFGRSLAYRDGVLVVGSSRAAYVFQRSNGVWTQRQKLTAPAADGVFSFSDALRYENGTLAISARRAGLLPGHTLPGTVYIYQRNAAGMFIARGKLTSPDASANDGFGAAISTAGTVMVIGAPGAGRAYIFRPGSTGVLRHNQTLVPSDLESPQRGGFGGAVAIDRQMIIVGAPAVGEDEAQPNGAAYGFTPGGGIYVETFKLEPGREEFNQRHVLFGRQIAMFDQRIVIGAQQVISSDAPLNGFVGFSYTRSGSSVLPRGVMVSNLTSTSLSLANQRVLVGIACPIEFFCDGRASLYNLNVFE